MAQKDIAEIMKALGEKKEYLRQKYAVRGIGVFGSYVRHESHADSDLDVLVSPLTINGQKLACRTGLHVRWTKRPPRDVNGRRETVLIGSPSRQA